MKTNKILFTLLIAATLIGKSHAVVLLETHFAGTGSNVSGGTLSGFDYTTANGLTGAVSPSLQETCSRSIKLTA
jgi:hypothetical protein